MQSSSSTNYRVDKIKKLDAIVCVSNKNTQNNQIKPQIPCGMSSIIYIDNRPPRSFKQLKDAFNHSKEALLYSRWNEKKQSYIPIAISYISHGEEHHVRIA